MRIFIAFILVLAPLTSRGDIGGKNNISRGGFGFLFPDQNSTSNVGETARTEAFATQLSGGKFTGTHEMSIVGSSAWSNGKIAISGYGSLYGKDPLDTAQRQEAYGAGIGYVFSDVAFSISYQKEQDVHWTIARTPTNYRLKIGASKSWDSFSMGVSTSGDSANQDENDGRVEVAFGLKGKSTAIELVNTLSTQPNAWSIALLAKWQGQMMYIASGGAYLKSAEAFQFVARAGFIWQAVDVSAYVTQIIKDAENPFSGASIRLTL